MLIDVINPMYDIAFKYLIDDDTCAKNLLSEIINKEIIECELLNNEIISKKQTKNHQTILKLDFKAKVKTTDNKHRLMIIEVQKALLDSNILRFRQYLGHQYIDKKNTYISNGKNIPYPIITVYFLGYTISGINNNDPILKIKPTIYSYSNGEQATGSSQFIDCLTHEMVLIQMQGVKKDGNSQLERFLANFTALNQQIITINDQHIDKKFVNLVRRLHEATMKKEIVEQMQRENVLQEEWNNLQMEKEKAIQEKEKAVFNEIKERKLKEEERKLKEEERKLKEAAIKTMIELGISKFVIAKKLQIPMEQIEMILLK